MNAATTNPSLLWALEWARQGGKVFPCHGFFSNGRCTCRKDCGRDAGKHPHWEQGALEHGKDDATSDEKQILAWARKWPDANWAYIPISRKKIVFDVDGEAGQSALKSLPGYRKLPKTFMVKTGREGGFHVRFELPPDSNIKDGDLAPLVLTVKCAGYVMCPGCLHRSGKRYEVFVDAPDAPIPDWLLAVTETRKKLASAVQPAATAHSRHNTMKELALNWHNQNKGRDEILAGLLAHNALFREPKPDSEWQELTEWVIQQPRRGKSARSETVVGARADLVCLADVENKAVPYLWPNYVPGEMLSILAGMKGAAKTELALAFAAGLTHGLLPYPEGTVCPPTNVLYLTYENHHEYVIAPRFRALGGDLNRFFWLRGWVSGDGDGAASGCVSLQHLNVLQDALTRTKAGLVVIDPLQSFIGADIDWHRANQIRPIFDRLAQEIAVKFRCAILLICHLRKSEGDALSRILGSTDISAVVRSVMFAGPNNQVDRALLHKISNVGSESPTLGYRIEPDPANPDVPHLTWTGISTFTEAEVLGGDSDPTQNEAIEFLDRLIPPGASIPAKRVEQEAKDAGLSFDTVKRAKGRLGVKSQKPGMDIPWVWTRQKAEESEGSKLHSSHSSGIKEFVF